MHRVHDLTVMYLERFDIDVREARRLAQRDIRELVDREKKHKRIKAIVETARSCGAMACAERFCVSVATVYNYIAAAKRDALMSKNSATR